MMIQTSTVILLLAVSVFCLNLVEIRAAKKPRRTKSKMCDAQNLIRTDLTGFISYPQQRGIFYKKDQKCIWQFHLEANQNLVIQFSKLQITKDKNGACQDFLQMPDGYRMCGSQVPIHCYAYHSPDYPNLCKRIVGNVCKGISVNDKSLQQWKDPTIVFESDKKQNGKGFKLSYDIVNCTKPATTPRTTAKRTSMTTKPIPTDKTRSLGGRNFGLSTSATSTSFTNVTLRKDANNTDLIIALIVVLLVLALLAVTVALLLLKRKSRNSANAKKELHQNNNDDVYTVADDPGQSARHHAVIEEQTYAECGPPGNYGMVDNQLYNKTVLQKNTRQMVHNELYKPMPQGGLNGKEKI